MHGLPIRRTGGGPPRRRCRRRRVMPRYPSVPKRWKVPRRRACHVPAGAPVRWRC